MYFHSLFIFFKLLLLSRTLHRLYVHGTSYLSPTSRITLHCYYLQGYELTSCIVIYCFSYLVLFSICIYYMAYILRHLIYFTHLRATPYYYWHQRKEPLSRVIIYCLYFLIILIYSHITRPTYSRCLLDWISIYVPSFHLFSVFLTLLCNAHSFH